MTEELIEGILKLREKIEKQGLKVRGEMAHFCWWSMAVLSNIRHYSRTC